MNACQTYNIIWPQTEVELDFLLSFYLFSFIIIICTIVLLILCLDFIFVQYFFLGMNYACKFVFIIHSEIK